MSKIQTKIKCPECKKGILDLKETKEEMKKQIKAKFDEEMDNILEKI